MTISVVTPPIIYPESDGKPMADNTIQFRLITKFQGGLDALFGNDPNVFVAGDLFWYPVEKKPKIKQADDVMVVFGRPKSDRRSYKQWEEDNIPPQVVFEIASESNTEVELEQTKLGFYDRYGVEEYYVYYPDRVIVKGWLRIGSSLEPISSMSGWVSPRMSVRFEIEDNDLQLYSPDGERFETVVEIIQGRKQERQRAEQERQRAEREQQRAEQQQQRAQQEQQRAQQEQQRAQQEQQRAEQEQQRAEREQQRAQQEQQRAEQEQQRAEQAERERDAAVTGLLAKGWSLDQIAELFGLSVEEVRKIAN